MRTTVKNVGDTDLAGVSIPLYVVDGRDRLIQATPFAATFKPCPSAPLPKPFKTGAKVDACLVYLVPDRGRLEAVSFRPDPGVRPDHLDRPDRDPETAKQPNRDSPSRIGRVRPSIRTDP